MILAESDGLKPELTCHFFPSYMDVHGLVTIETVKKRPDMDRKYFEQLAFARLKLNKYKSFDDIFNRRVHFASLLVYLPGKLSFKLDNRMFNLI